MIPLGALSPRMVRETYLRGINLGAAWHGTGGDSAIMSLLMLEISRAETIMGIHFLRYRILTWPEAGLVEGTDFDRLGLLVPYRKPEPAQEFYPLTLHFHDVQAITRIRLYEG